MVELVNAVFDFKQEQNAEFDKVPYGYIYAGPEMYSGHCWPRADCLIFNGRAWAKLQSQEGDDVLAKINGAPE
jgi:hypothetical protein